MTKQTKAQIRAKDRYNKENTVTYCLRLNKNTDKDIIDRLESPVDIGGSRNGYIKSLIRMDILLDKQAD